MISSQRRPRRTGQRPWQRPRCGRGSGSRTGQSEAKNPEEIPAGRANQKQEIQRRSQPEGTIRSKKSRGDRSRTGQSEARNPEEIGAGGDNQTTRKIGKWIFGTFVRQNLDSTVPIWRSRRLVSCGRPKNVQNKQKSKKKPTTIRKKIRIFSLSPPLKMKSENCVFRDSWMVTCFAECSRAVDKFNAHKRLP